MMTDDDRRSSYNDTKALYQHFKDYRQKNNPDARTVEIWGEGAMNMFFMTLVLGPYFLIQKQVKDFPDGGPRPILPLKETVACLHKYAPTEQNPLPERLSFSGEDAVLLYLLASIGRRCVSAFDKQTILDAFDTDKDSDEHFFEWKEFYLQKTDELLEYISWRFRGDEAMVKLLEQYSQGTEHFREQKNNLSL